MDINDLTIVLTNYNQSTGMSWGTGDFNGDGKVDINDLTIVLTHYNQSLGSSAGGTCRRAGAIGAAVDARRLGRPAVLRMAKTEMTQDGICGGAGKYH